jgi:hypothetical protein
MGRSNYLMLPYFQFLETRRIHNWFGRIVQLAIWLVVGLLLTGCTTTYAPPVKSDGVPLNFFASSPVLPVSLRRVAILPVACDEPGSAMSEGCETLRPGLLEELIRTKKFEVVSVNPEIMRRYTGRADWTGAEILPADFFNLLQREYGCDAVLFCQLTTFRAYAPLTIGWRMKMVDVRTQRIIWAADEVFDAKAAAGVGAWLIQQGRQLITPEFSDEWAVLNSPSRFGRYSAAKLLATLPGR